MPPAVSLDLWIPAYAALFTLLILVYTTTTSLAQSRRERKNKARHDADVVAGIDKTALQQVQTDLATVITILRGKTPTWDDPHPPPGMVEVVNRHTEMIRDLSPNGGDTNKTGDLMLRVADKLGVKADDQDPN